MRHTLRTKFFGPNWHADFPVIEYRFVLEAEEVRELRESGDDFRDRLLQLLEEGGISQSHLSLLRRKLPVRPRKLYAFLLCGTALALQRHAGHRVHRARSEAPKGYRWTRAIFEHEDCQSGTVAGEIALHLLNRVMPIKYPTNSGDPDSKSSAELIERYRERFSKRVLPAETRMIIAAADRAGIPWLKLDREPINGPQARWRITENGALLLGQGKYQQLLDGSFCVSRGGTASAFLGDRLAAYRKLAEFAAALPHSNGRPALCYTMLDAVKASEQIGYPLAVKPVRRAVGQGVTVGIRDLGALMQAVSDAKRVAGQFIVERFVRGVNVRLLLVGGELLSAFDARGSRSLAGLHDSIRDMAVTIARALDSGLMVLTVVAPRLDRPLAETGGAFVDLDVSPELGQLLPRTRALRRSIVDRYVEWLFPNGAPSRIPIVAITGTNGKTTTSRMVARMLETGGYRTGLSCSDGLYLGAERIVGKDPRRFKRKMRHRLILDPNVEAAAMEFYLAVIKRHGFPFQSCDVSVLTNVAADHLQPGWETVEQLADIKRAVLERADRGVVMNADDANTERLLAAFQPPRLALASMRCSIDEIRLKARDDACYVILEPTASGEERVVIYDGDKRIDLVAVDEIPATMSGKARFNIENALHATAAGYLLGLDPAVLAAALRSFSNNFEETPGRLNIYDGLPFRVIMDYAHNEHGYARLSEFTDQLDVTGRRILVYSVSGDRVPHDVRHTTLAPVGHFDHFICRDFPDPRGRQPGEMPRIMQGLLRETGIPPDRVRAFDDPTEALEVALRMAREGDLVVFSPGSQEMEKLWQRICNFEYVSGRDS